jgi:hypothetical protein
MGWLVWRPPAATALVTQWPRHIKVQQASKTLEFWTFGADEIAMEVSRKWR